MWQFCVKFWGINRTFSSISAHYLPYTINAVDDTQAGTVVPIHYETPGIVDSCDGSLGADGRSLYIVHGGYEYDAHYLIGNYYSWPAATAGSGNDVASSGDAADSSICPANWRLPAYSGTGSFRNLLSPYGLTSSITSGNNNIATSPLYFVRGGYVDPGSYLSNAGSFGAYWAASANGLYGSDAYILSFDSSTVHPFNDGYYRYYGSSIRCVADWK